METTIENEMEFGIAGCRTADAYSVTWDLLAEISRNERLFRKQQCLLDETQGRTSKGLGLRVYGVAWEFLANIPI